MSVLLSAALDGVSFPDLIYGLINGFFLLLLFVLVSVNGTGL